LSQTEQIIQYDDVKRGFYKLEELITPFTPFRIENAQSNVTFSLIYAHKVGVLNEKRCNISNADFTA